MRFLEEEEVQTTAEWMDPALRAVNGSFTPAEAGQIRNFFSEVNYRDPDSFRPHMHHWIELARIREDPHASPIRATPSLYNIFDSRSEGLATGVEEMFMHLGLLEGSPRSRELTWIMLAQPGRAGAQRPVPARETYSIWRRRSLTPCGGRPAAGSPTAISCAASRASTCGSRATARAT